MTSQINPANIDGSYPVAGQDNNSQGFRDNFTNIKVNFQDAAAELTDLQNKVILKSALNGSTLDNNMSDALLVAAKIQDFAVAKVTVGGTSGAISINYSSGHYQSITTSGSISLSFINFPATTNYGYIKLQINITNVAHTVTLPAGVTLGTSGLQGYSAGVITFGSTGTYEFAFGTYDAGATITIFDLNRALTNFANVNITLGTVLATTVTATGNITGGNVSTAGLITATGNVTGGNIITAGLVTVGGNVTGGNIITVGQVTATGDVTGGNVRGFVRPTAGSASQAPVVITSGTNTSVPAAGAIEYDGVVFYSTRATSQRALMSGEQFVTLTANYTANDTAAAQKVFNSTTNGAVAVTADTAYFIEAVYAIAPAINFNAVSLATVLGLADGAGLVNNVRYIADTTVGLSPGPTAVNRTQVVAPSATTVTAASPGGAATNFTVHLNGVIRTTTAGNLIPQIQFSGTPGSAPVIQLGSYFKLTPIGNGTVSTLGPWT
jgi:hypothetical protein